MWRMCFEPFRAIRVWISRDRLQTRLGKPSPVGLAGQIVFSRVQLSMARFRWYEAGPTIDLGWYQWQRG